MLSVQSSWSVFEAAIIGTFQLLELLKLWVEYDRVAKEQTIRSSQVKMALRQGENTKTW